MFAQASPGRWYRSLALVKSPFQFEKEIDHFSQAVNEKQYDTVMPSLSRDGTFPPEALAATARSMVDLDMLKTEPDMMNFLTTRFLPQPR